MNIAWLALAAIVISTVSVLLWLIVRYSGSNNLNTNLTEQCTKSFTLNPRLIAIMLVSIIIPAISFSLYNKLGAADQLVNFYSASNTAYRQQLKVIQTVAAKWNARELRLKLDVRADPANAMAWRELAALYIFKQDSVAATAALEQATALEPADQELFINYLMHLLKTEDGILLPQQRAKLSLLLANAQYKTFALNLLAIDSFKRKNYVAAQQYWNKVLAAIPDDGDINSKNTKIEIGRLIAQARKLNSK